MVILAVGREDGEGEDVCGDEWQAVVRKEDVRATEKEKVVCGEGFRVGDVVRGVVVRALWTVKVSRIEWGMMRRGAKRGWCKEGVAFPNLGMREGPWLILYRSV